ncbi:MAG: hypothetical protein JJ934_12760 [Pseudomonadales bacterium]|nr:hypothetical protein [Pseudomonadales bacterium]MBO6564264.1 hypothetical protein [Pseudomonadales bacterium]MBO6597572.1 hypothetical protein [Pseudomonadales bacterium]MBO6657763.1 hypothetical protein [Pseudomonadales bacterium]
MLRVSMQVTERNIDLHVINGEADGVAEVPFANELSDFAEAVASFDEEKLLPARQALLEAAGEAVLVDAAGVAGNFQRMVRIADAMGIPVDSMDNEVQNQVRQELDLYRFRSSENSVSPA